MILTAVKPVNARLGKPSVNASNPRFISPGDKITVKSKVLGDPVEANNVWILTTEDEFFSSAGFQLTDEFRSLSFFDHLQTRPPLFNLLKIPELWQTTKQGAGVTIGIIDNGVLKHSALNGKVTQLNAHSGTNMSNHGTTMACIIGGFDEKEGKFGVAPMVSKILSYQIDVDDKSCNIEGNELLKALDAMEEAGANIVNMSFTCQQASFFPESNSGKLIQDKINSLVDKNIILICATGNENEHISKTADRYPAGYDNVFTVTGYNFREIIDFTSNCWDGISISTFKEHYFDDDLRENSNGTSGAAAIMTGFIACVYNKIKPLKHATLGALFSQMPFQKDPFGSEFMVPKFDANKFINLIN